VTREQAATDITIIGGGLVGASLALLLARVLPCRQIVLLEAKPFRGPDRQPSQPGFDQRSTALSPSSVGLFADLGLWESLRAQASPIHQIQVSDRGQFGAARFGPEDNDGKPLGYVISNMALGRALLDRLQNTDNIDARAPVEVESLKPVRGGMQVNFSGGDRPDSLRADLAIIADGAGSPLAAGLGVTSHSKDYGQCALIANVGYEQPHQGRAFERFTPLGPLALLPLAGEEQTESALIWTRPLEKLAEVQAWSDSEFLQELQREFGYRLGHFTRVSRRSVYPLALQLAGEQVRSSLVLMGNAAHSLHPVAGQGFNLALRDGARLAQALAAGAAQGLALGDLKLLQAYEQQQKRDQAMTVGLSDSFIRIFATGQPAVVAGRNLGLLSLELISSWRETFLSQMAGRSQARARLGL
jgi:2-octaprenyl-6-methoxyphenol hydroxylase